MRVRSLRAQDWCMAIACGYSDVVLCGGIEHMTHIPMGGGGAIKFPDKLFTEPQYKKLDVMFSLNMGFTAQKLQELSGISRETMDKFAARSHQTGCQNQGMAQRRDPAHRDHPSRRQQADV